MPEVAAHEPQYETIGEIGELAPEEWLQVMEAVEPCGRGNPFPLISAGHARLTREPTELCLRESGQPWAWKAEFTADGKTISVIWRDLDNAAQTWRLGNEYDLELELSAKNYNGKSYYNWSVISCSARAKRP